MRSRTPLMLGLLEAHLNVAATCVSPIFCGCHVAAAALLAMEAPVCWALQHAQAARGLFFFLLEKGKM